MQEPPLGLPEMLGGLAQGKGVMQRVGGEAPHMGLYSDWLRKSQVPWASGTCALQLP